MATIVGSFNDSNQTNNSRNDDRYIDHDYDYDQPRETGSQFEFGPSLSNQAFISETVVLHDIIDNMNTSQ